MIPRARGPCGGTPGALELKDRLYRLESIRSGGPRIMPRCRWILGPASALGMGLAGMAAVPATATATGAGEGLSGETALTIRFVRGLADRGYSDWALDYVEQLRKAPDTPADTRAVLDYEEAVGLGEEAAHTADLVRRGGLYDEAARKLDGFLKAHPDHPAATEATRQLGHLLVEGGHVAVLQSMESKLPGQVQTKLADARILFGRARDAFARAEGPLKSAYDAMPKSISEDDPLRDERDRARDAWVDARFQKALVDYEEAQTYPPGDGQRAAVLDRARGQFEQIADQHRVQMAGVVARMWQGKCFEERGGVGDFGRAMGIYDDLMAEPDARLKPLQRQVDYFRIILMGKRGDYTLAQDEAQRWLREAPKERHTDEGLGVLVEYGRDLLAMAKAPDGPRGPERDATLRKAADALGEVTKISSRHKRSAFLLLRQARGGAPKAAAGNGPIAAIPPNTKVDDAIAQADEASGDEKYDQAIALLRFALRKIDYAKEPEKANKARTLLAFSLYQLKRYDEADIVAEQVARAYPKDEMAPKAIEFALAALVEAYNEAKEADRQFEADRLASLADFTAKTIPDTEAADEARLTLGRIEMSRRRFADAAKALEALRESSPKRADALTTAGTAHFLLSQDLKPKSPEAVAELDQSVGLLQKALKLRQDNKVPPTDPALLGNACDLAEIQLFREKPAEALALLEPLARANAERKPSEEEAPLRGRLISTELRALISTNNVAKAIDEMKALEAVGGPGQGMAQLYFTLGRLLEKEMEALKTKGDAEKLKTTKETYEKFLDALASRKEGQTYETLEWAGESMLALGAAAKAAPIFEAVLKTFAADPKFLADPEGKPKLNRARMKRIVALREAGQFDEAEQELKPLLAQKTLDVYMEQGRLLEARAEATKSGWDKAANFWQSLATRLGRARTKGPEFYEVWLHLAMAQARQGKAADALKTLNATKTLYPSLGGPEMKQRYLDLIKRIEAER